MECNNDIKFNDDAKELCCSRYNLLGLWVNEVRKYSDIVRYDYLEDNSTITTGGTGFRRVIVGGALFGTPGAIVGALTRKRSTETYVFKISVIIVLVILNLLQLNSNRIREIKPYS